MMLYNLYLDNHKFLPGLLDTYTSYPLLWMKVILQKHSCFYSLNKALLLIKNLKSFDRLMRRLSFGLKKFKYLAIGIWTEQNFTVTHPGGEHLVSEFWPLRATVWNGLLSSRKGTSVFAARFQQRHRLGWHFTTVIRLKRFFYAAEFSKEYLRRIKTTVFKDSLFTYIIKHDSSYLQTELGSKWLSARPMFVGSQETRSNNYFPGKCTWLNHHWTLEFD